MHGKQDAENPFGMTGLWDNLGRMMKRDARAKLLFCQSETKCWSKE